MRVINGYDVIGIMPVLSPHRIISGYVVTAERKKDWFYEVVTAHVSSLNSTEWNHGNYFTSEDVNVARRRGLADMLVRSGHIVEEADLS